MNRHGPEQGEDKAVHVELERLKLIGIQAAPEQSLLVSYYFTVD